VEAGEGFFHRRSHPGDGKSKVESGFKHDDPKYGTSLGIDF
jgi:hypothetical protein